MKLTVTRACGHVEDLVVYGGHYEDQEEYLSRQLCTECYRAAQTARAAAATVDLPPLTGSERQVAWATTIRARAVETIRDYVRQLQAAPQTSEEHNVQYGRIQDYLLSQTEARWWIDRRYLHTGWSYVREGAILLGLIAGEPEVR